VDFKHNLGGIHADTGVKLGLSHWGMSLN